MNFIYESITDFIFVKDEVEPSDVILIPGGSHVQLIEEAARLYKLGLAPYILPSGGKNKKLEKYKSEWEFLVEKGIELGVPREAFLKEDKATNTFENAQFSLEVLKEKDIKFNKIILVCKNFHSRRCYLTYAVVFPKNVDIKVSSVVDGKNIHNDDWYLDDKKIDIIMSEVEKIGKYFKEHIKYYKED